MAQSLLMKQGLEGILNHEKKFEDEARFGQNIYGTTAFSFSLFLAALGTLLSLVRPWDVQKGLGTTVNIVAFREPLRF